MHKKQWCYDFSYLLENNGATTNYKRFCFFFNLAIKLGQQDPVLKKNFWELIFSVCTLM